MSENEVLFRVGVWLMVLVLGGVGGTYLGRWLEMKKAIKEWPQYEQGIRDHIRIKNSYLPLYATLAIMHGVLFCAPKIIELILNGV